MALAEVRKSPGIKDRQISDTAGIKPHKLDPSYRFVHDDMKGLWNGCQSDGTVASEVDAEINYLRTGRGTVVEKLNINTQVSGKPFPSQGTVGTDLAIGNQTSAQGAEFVFGGNHARGNYAYVVGTDAFFMKGQIKLEDVSGIDLWVGFRKQATFAAAVGSYSDFATIFYDGTASTAAGATKTQTRLNSGTATTTDMSLATADADTLTFEISVDLGGRVRYKFNGAYNTAAVEFIADSGDVYVPFIAYLNTADVAGYAELKYITIGLQEANVR